MDLGLRDQVFIVTGGSQGLGRSSALALAAEGARIVLVARDAARLDLVGSELGDSAVVLSGDLGDPALPDSAVEVALSRFGRLDGAIVSVGGPAIGNVDTVTDTEWREAFDTVFLGALRLCRRIADHARAAQAPAALAVILSTSAKSPVEGLDTSNGLRPGLAMLVKSMADQWGPSGIRINALLPGRIATDRLRALEASTIDPDQTRRRYEAAIPLRRYGDPAEFGSVAAFAVSPAASYMTGSVLCVDGGLSRAL